MICKFGTTPCSWKTPKVAALAKSCQAQLQNLATSVLQCFNGDPVGLWPKKPRQRTKFRWIWGRQNRWPQLASFAHLLIVGGVTKTGWEKKKKNKMKPTNPNADTYVEKQRFNTYLSQFPANPLVEHPDLTH